MIYILHGDNTTSAHRRLLDIIEQNQDHEKIYLQPNQIEDLQTITNSNDLFGSKKIIIAENFISKLKLKPQSLKEIKTSNILVLWEKKEITKAQASAFVKVAIVEIFKLPPTLFNFLDSLTQKSKTAIAQLEKIDPDEKTSLAWQISNRLALMILATEGAGESVASKITGRYVADWQLRNARNQARNIDYQQLKQLFLASLKIDYLTKTGATNIPQRTLISLMLMKYLPN